MIIGNVRYTNLSPVQVWNLLNGHNLHKLEPVTSSEVTGIICLYDNRLLAVGWSQQIVQYDITGAKVRSKFHTWMNTLHRHFRCFLKIHR